MHDVILLVISLSLSFVLLVTINPTFSDVTNYSMKMNGVDAVRMNSIVYVYPLFSIKMRPHD
jgi:hypothetical protein